MSQQAQNAIKAARIACNLGRKAGKGFATKSNVHPGLFRLACQLEACRRAGI
jgi:hypothetical protein